MAGKWLGRMFFQVPDTVLYKFADCTVALVTLPCCQCTAVIRLLGHGIARQVLSLIHI